MRQQPLSGQPGQQRPQQQQAGFAGFGPGFGHRGMGMPVEKAKRSRPTFRRLLTYLKPRRLQIGLVLLMAILSTAFNIVSPKIMGRATTKLFEGLMMKVRGVPGARIDFEYIWDILLLLAAFYVISAVFGLVQQWVMARVSQQTVYDLRHQAYAKLARLPLRFFDGRTHGETLSRVTNDIDSISNALQQSLTQLITSLVFIIGIIIMMLTISPVLTLVCMITLPLSAIATAGVARRSQTHFKAQARSLGQLNGHVEEMFTGHRIIKAYGREQASLAQFDRINAALFDAGWRSQFISGMIMPLMFFVNNLGYVIVAVVGSLFVTQNRIQIGDVQAFIQYSRQFGQPIAQTANIANMIQSAIAAAERVFELLDEAEEAPDRPESAAPAQVAGAVRMEQVSFGYQPGVPVITDLNIDVRPGQVIAIVGPTGAGKTTLVNLLMRFYEIGGGRITLDGRDLREFRRGQWRSQFGMVLQDTWLFHGTIRENIAYGRAAASAAEVIRAARAAHADHFIRTLPAGYDTVLNEEASNISQGQKQLLTIARAILADPAILILDEATSSVDTRTEVYIQKAMQELMQGRTSFVIAHRLSTIRDADLILVMNHGRVIEQGTHRELLAQRGFYADLYHSQFTGGRMGGEAI